MQKSNLIRIGFGFGTYLMTPPSCFSPVVATPIGFSSSTGTKNFGGAFCVFLVFERRSHSGRGWGGIPASQKVTLANFVTIISSGFSRVCRQNHDPAAVCYYPPRAHLTRLLPNMRSTRTSPTMLLLLIVTLALACVAPVEARLKVRAFESQTVLTGVSVRTFRSRDVQRSFCRAFTDSVGLDEKVLEAFKYPEQQLECLVHRRVAFKHTPR